MALPSGVYVFENVRTRNWAVLTSDNDGDDVKSGTDANKNSSGHKWDIQRLKNGTYLIRNQQFQNHASYRLADVSDHPSVISIRTGNPYGWRINNMDGFYWISDLDGDRCWTLKYDHLETPITLEEYTHSDHQHWKIIPENDMTSRTPANPGPSLRVCPPPTAAFTGRQDFLLKMHDYFSSDLRKRHVFVLHGLGGIGKSQITLKFIEECQVDTNPSRFSQVFFIDASSAETITADLKNIALAKGIGGSAEDTIRWLSGLNEEFLLVFDNADDTTLNLRDFFPRSSHGNIIITSRNSETRIYAPNLRSESKVSRLSPDDATDLLITVARVSPEESGETRKLASDIVEELGHLALAVVQAGAYISKSRCGLDNYLEMYRERRIRFLEEYRNQIQKIDDYERTVYTTWTVSFEKLSTRSVTFLNICAFFHHDGISRLIFERAAANMKTRTIKASDGSKIAVDLLSSFLSGEGQWELHKFLEVIMEISSYSLIDYDERNKTYSIHPLVHTWTRNRLSDSSAIHESSQIILSLSIGSPKESKYTVFQMTLLPHIDALLHGTPTNADVAEWLWIPFFECGRFGEALKFLNLASETTKQALGEEHPNTLAIMSDLSLTYSNLGRWKEAEELEVRVIEARKRILGEEHPDTLITMSYLAWTYLDMGRYNEAEELLSRLMDICVRTLGKEHPRTLSVMFKLTWTYSFQGRWKESQELGARVTEMSMRVHGEENPRTLAIMSILGWTYARQGRPKEAEELLARVLDMSVRILGEDHPDTLAVISNLASTYQNQGRLEEAEEIQTRVVELRKRDLGEEHTDTLMAMSNLVWTYSDQGRSNEAEELLVQVVQMSKTVLGEKHPDTLYRAARLATIGNRKHIVDEGDT